MKLRNNIIIINGTYCKTCNICGIRKALADYSKAKCTKLGLRGECKRCQAKTRRAYALRNYDAEYEYSRKMCRLYGLTSDKLEELHRIHEGRCAVCQGSNESHNRKLHIDHCHKTGKVRGLLCFRCNSVLGHVNDDPIILHKLISYLSKHNEAK